MQTTKRIIGPVVAAAMLMTGAACSGDSSSAANRVASLGGNTTTTRGSGGTGDKKNFEDAMLEFSRCMREHGVNMPDPTFSGDGSGHGFIAKVGGPDGGGPKPDDATFKAAQAACEPIMKKAEQDMPRPSPEEEARMRDQALKFARCMREHGVDVPDPTFDSNGRTRIEMHADAPSGGTAGAGPGSGGPPKMDANFEAAMKACENDAPMKMRRSKS